MTGSSQGKASRRPRRTPDLRPRRFRSVFVGVLTFIVSTFAFLSIAVSTGLAVVGWQTIPPADINLASGASLSTGSAVYSLKMRMYQNQNQVDRNDPPLFMFYRYPAGGVYDDFVVYWNDGTPVNWNNSGGNKVASCDNLAAYGKAAGRLITCQFYSTV